MAEHETHEAVVKLARRELEDHERINCWFRPEFVRALIDRLEAAHRREVDALKQRCAELDAEIAAKDEVIERLNDAIAEEQRRKLATAENPSAVGDCARTLGFTPKDKVVGVWMDDCEVCHQRKPCTDLWHDWKQVKKGAK